MKLAAVALTLIFAAASSVAVAGVTPNSAASAAQRSGARIAPTKPAPQNPNETEAGDQGAGTAK